MGISQTPWVNEPVNFLFSFPFFAWDDRLESVKKSCVFFPNFSPQLPQWTDGCMGIYTIFETRPREPDSLKFCYTSTEFVATC